jgi:hypothetical protein
MPRSKEKTGTMPSATPDEVIAGHPLRAAIDEARKVIRAAVPSATESVKWNAPSFATTEHFATFFLRAKSGFQIVLHLGAKPRANGVQREDVADPTGLLEWRGDDRAILTFRDEADVKARAAAFSAVLRQWVTFV